MWGSSETQSKYEVVSYIYDWIRESADSPKRPQFLLKSRLSSKTERRQWHSKKLNDPKPFLLMLLMLLPYIR